MPRPKTTNELEFQGQVVSWLNDEIRKRPGLGLDKATQEKPGSRQRNDCVIWRNRASEDAFLELELKTPSTAITDPVFLADALAKAQRWGAPYFAIWNMQEAELYRTPLPGVAITPAEAIKTWTTDKAIRTVEDWLNLDTHTGLRRRAVEILDIAFDFENRPSGNVGVIDSSVFVERLTVAITALRTEVYTAIRAATAKRAVRARMRALAAEQGFIGFVDDIEFALAGQYSYRIVGQILFYFAFRRKQPRLKPLQLEATDILPDAFRKYWDDVRRYDYEALFAPHELDSLVSIPKNGQRVIKALVDQLGHYEWSALRDDVLGAIFQALIPWDEQHLLGQFYTPKPVADLLTSFALDGESPRVLDPGCGSGTFLLSAYDALAAQSRLTHRELLSTIWGMDISPFAAELAAINLFKQDLGEYDNFPRILPGDFFSRTPGDSVNFPPPKPTGPKKVAIPIPKFDAIVGNPPYLRSQNQDDLDSAYKARLFASAKALGVQAAAKTDLFLFFIYHAIQFMEEGSRLAFVTPASWLTADYAAPFHVLLSNRLKLVAVIGSMAESFFTSVDVNTVLLVVEKRSSREIVKGELLRFVMLRSRLSDLLPHDGNYWPRLKEFADMIESYEKSVQTKDFRVTVVNAAEEFARLDQTGARALNWSKYMRAPLSYYEILGGAA